MVVVADVGSVIAARPCAPAKLQVPARGALTALPPMVKVGVEHNLWSAPASAVGCSSLRITTSLVAELHTPLATVQVRVMSWFSGTPVTVVVLEVGVVIVAPKPPPTNVHVPLSGAETALPPIVKLDVLQSVWSDPAVAVGFWSLRIITSSLAGAQTPLDTVHCRVMSWFSGTPVTVVVLEVGVVIVAPKSPPTNVQVPLNGAETALPPIVKLDVLQSVWSDPAVAVGFWSI